MADYIGYSKESCQSFLKDYIEFGIENRLIVADALLYNIENTDERTMLLRGAKIYSEYGAAIEDEMAFAYAIVRHNDSTAIAFLHALMNYTNSELRKFFAETDFYSGAVKVFGFLSPEVLRDFKGLDATKTKQDYARIINNLNVIKNEINTGQFLSAYNKLKHVFFVKRSLPDNIIIEEKAAFIYMKSKRKDLFADVFTAIMDIDELKVLRENIKATRDTIWHMLNYFDLLWEYKEKFGE